MTLDPATKRFVSIFLAPLFLLLKTKLGIDVPEPVQELLVVSVIAYVAGSHAKEALVKRAEVAGSTAAASIQTPADAAKALSTPETKP